MRWADEVPDRYEDARFTYATLIQQYGHLDDLELRMLDYFMRTDQLSEVVRLKDQFQANPGAKINPLIYAKLGGYLVSRNQLDDVRDILFRVLDVDDTLPEAHFYLARYFNKIEEYPEEEKAIRNVLLHLKDIPSLGRDRLSMLIQTYNRNGEILMEKEEFLSAEESFLKAVKLYEDGRSRKILGQSREFGRIYANIGDIYYYRNNAYDTALQQYIKAEQNGYYSKEMNYKKGFIYYDGEDFREALMEFFKTSEGFSTNRNLMFATANTLYKLGDYYSAEGFYFDLLATLEQERLSIPFLLPDERPEHRGLIELLIKGYNNLGVNQYYLADRSGRRDDMYSSALVNLTKSAQLVDAYTREPVGLGRSDASSLAWLNQRGMLYPLSDFKPQIFTEIPKDMDDFLF